MTISRESFTVIGAGHGGKAMAAHLAIKGFDVTLYNRTFRHIEAIHDRGGIQLYGEGERAPRFGRLRRATSDLAEALSGAAVIMVVVPAFAHKDVARQVAPYLEDGQILLLNPGRTLGALEFRLALRTAGCTADVIVAEAQTFIYASRSDGPAQARIFRTKEAVPLAALPAVDTPAALDAIQPAYPQFIDGKTILHTGLNNIGAIFHPTIILHNAGWIEATGGDFEFYIEGVTPTVARIMEAVDRERTRLGKALGLELISAQEWLKLAYNADGDSLFESIQNQDGYRGIRAPTTLRHRYLTEDIPNSLIPMASLGEMFGFRVRAMRSLIRLAIIAHGVDYWLHGRTVRRLGLEGISTDQLIELVTNPEPEWDVYARAAAAKELVGSGR
jgi:opine dehydrogenase